MPKVKLTKNQLREIIWSALNESSNDTGDVLTQEDRFNPMIVTPVMRNQYGYLFNALAQFSKEVVYIEPNKLASPADMKEYFQQKAAITGNIDDSWQPTAADQARYLEIYLRLKIIDALNDPKNAKDPRYAFIMADAIYVRDSLVAAESTDLGVARNFFEIQTEHQFSSQEFFNKLADVEKFVNVIVNPDNSWKAGVGSSLEDVNPNPKGIFVEKSVGDAAVTRVKTLVGDYVDKLTTLYKQFDTDFVETFFCGPLLNPGIWKRYVNNPGHPLATPWRLSYTVLNVASNAASVSGGTIALYAKTMDFIKRGSSYQPGEDVAAQDPWVASGIFSSSLNESKKIFLTQEELRRVINATLMVEGWRDVAADIIRGGLRGAVKGGAEESAAKAFKFDPSAAESAAETAVKAGFSKSARLGRYADELSKIIAEFAPAAKLPVVQLDKEAYKQIYTTVLGEVGGTGAEVKRARELLADLLADAAARRAAGEKIGDIITYLTSSGRGLDKISNMSLPDRDRVLRLLRLAGDETVDGEKVIADIAKKVDVDFAKQQLVDALRNDIKTPVTSQSGQSSLVYDPDTAQFTNYFKNGDPPITYSLNDFINDASLQQTLNDFWGSSGQVLLDKAKSYQAKLAIIDAGKIPVEGNPDIATIVAKKTVGSDTGGLYDAISGSLVSPQKALAQAESGLADTAEQVDLITGKLDKISKPGLFARIGQIGQEGGPLAALGKFSRKGFKEDKLRYLAWAPLRLPGEAGRLTARSIRAIAGDTSAIGRFSDTIATSGIYSTLAGLIVFNTLIGAGKSVTPGSTGGFGKFINLLDTITPDGALSPGLAQVIIDVLNMAVSKTDITEPVKKLVSTDPLAAQVAMSDILKLNYMSLTQAGTQPEYFEGLSTDDVSGAFGARATQTIRQVPGLLADLFRKTKEASSENAAAVQEIEKSAQATASTLEAIATNSQLTRALGNAEWQKLEASRKSALETVIKQISGKPTAIASSTSSIASLKTIMTKYYPASASIAQNVLLSSLSGLLTYVFGMEGKLTPWGISGGQDMEELESFVLYLARSDAPPSNMLYSSGNRTLSQEELQKINASLTKVRDTFKQLESGKQESVKATSPTP